MTAGRFPVPQRRRFTANDAKTLQTLARRRGLVCYNGLSYRTRKLIDRLIDLRLVAVEDGLVVVITPAGPDVRGLLLVQ